jgi:hypothetical protein
MLDDFLQAYLECAVFCSLNEKNGGQPLDKTHSWKDVSNESYVQATRDCKAFLDKASSWIVDKNFKYVTKEHTTVAQAGHDFWMTRDGQGCGFWDGDWREPAATILDNLAKSFNEIELYVGDDNKLHFTPTRKGN